MEVAELVARETIRETLARYAQYADSGRFAELARLFTPDGVLEIHGGERLAGRDAICAFLEHTKRDRAAGATPAYIRHHVSSLVIELTSPHTALGRSYFLAITDRGPDHWGRYRDELVANGSAWLFAHRLVRLDGRAGTTSATR